VISRKKKLVIAQITLFLLGVLIIIFTYYNKNQNEQIITKENKEKIKNQLNEQNNASSDIFYEIKYSGIDLSGNRYILTSKEASSNKVNPELVDMKFVEANFYFKDNTVLNVISDEGTYNNKTLDMIFNKNVNAKYEGSKLVADKANYSNSKSYLIISDNVIVTDQKGVVTADRLLFDIKKQNLNIISLNNNKINARINMK
jgi:lipopolysaccharide assembly outer membrane protein LptD (OstA)